MNSPLSALGSAARPVGASASGEHPEYPVARPMAHKTTRLSPEQDQERDEGIFFIDSSVREGFRNTTPTLPRHPCRHAGSQVNNVVTAQ
jgi:hypothetical protein